MSISGKISSYITFRRSFRAAIVLRILLIIYGEYHDRHSALKYTDVDYRVFSDATRFLLNPGKGDDPSNRAQGPLTTYLGWNLGDPYTRATYRYTPLLAILLLPNEFLHPAWGKLLFATADVFVGLILYHIFLPSVISASPLSPSKAKRKNGGAKGQKRPSPQAPTSPSSSSPEGIKHTAALWISALWLLNPMVANISTRGSAESVLGLAVVSCLALVLRGSLDAGAIMLGVAVHFKIYPFIYATSILALLARWDSNSRWWWITWKQIRFGLVSLGTFIGLGGVMFALWGHPFLEHTYLYHLARRDHRHNFSLYFYPTYLSYPPTEPYTNSSQLQSTTDILSNPLVSFLPQMALSLGSGFVFGRRAENLPFAFFVQTMTFVTFNKVCTSQYFMWYMWFLPLVLPKLRMSVARGVTVLLAWVGSQALWLSYGYRLEFLGENVYLSLWLASAAFLVANCYVLGAMIQSYN